MAIIVSGEPADSEHEQLYRQLKSYDATFVPTSNGHGREHRKPGKTPAFVYAVVFMSVVGGFLFGYDTGVVSGAMLSLRNPDSGVSGIDDTWQSILVSITVAAAAVFSIVGGFSNDYLGRRPTTMIASLLFMIGSIELGASPNRVSLLIGRIIVGSAIGLSSMTVPSYIAETTPAHIRGTMVTTFQLSITVGFFIAGVLDGAFYYVGPRTNWRYMFGVAAIPAAFQLVGFYFMPESPRWLAIHDKENQARSVLMRLTQDQEETDYELEAIEESQKHAERERQKLGNQNVLISMLKTPPVRRALIIGCVMQLFQQLCGINTVMYYSGSIVKMGGVRSESADIWFTSLTSGVNMLMTLPGLYLVEKLGRKTLILISMAGVIISSCILAIGFILISKHTSSHATQLYYNNTVFPEAANFTECFSSKIRDCDDCSYQDSKCGYCYKNDPKNSGSYLGACMGLNTSNSDYTAYGPCSANFDPVIAKNFTLDSGFCPTPYSALPILGMVLYLCSFSCGFGPVPWTVNSEIYPQWARSTGNALATATNWACNLIIASTFLFLTDAITRQGERILTGVTLKTTILQSTDSAFFLYAGITALGFIVMLLVLPETKQKTLEEIEDLFTGPVFVLFKKNKPISEKKRDKQIALASIPEGLEPNGVHTNKDYADDEKF